MNGREAVLLLPMVLLAALSVSGCTESTSGAPHRDAHPPELAGAAHTAENQKFTHYGAETELFLEAPVLVAGQTVEFAAHLTRLADFTPVSAGRLEVVLSGGNLPQEHFAADAPLVPGIFKPRVTPGRAGDRELTLVLHSAAGRLSHELGPVRVFASAAEAAANHDHADDDAGIVFTKEQQWKVDFAVAPAAKGNARTAVAGSGVLRAHPDGEALLSAPVAGQVNAAGAFPHVGMAVKRGQILAHLAPRLGGETDHAALEAAAAKARVVHDQARREARRTEALFAQDAVAEKRLQEAQAEERVAAAELAAASRRLDQYGNGRGGIPIRAPISGVIADVKAAPGAYAQEGALLFHVADTRRLWLEVRLPEAEAARLVKPSGVWFTAEGDEAVHDYDVGKAAKLIAVGRVIDPATRSVPVIFEFAAADDSLRLGQIVKAHVRTGPAWGEAVLVPAAALQDESGTATVYVQTGGESFERRIVRPGARDGALVEIRDGLAAGERVVTRGAYLVRLAATRTEPVGHGHAH